MNKILIVDDERFEREQLCQIMMELVAAGGLAAYLKGKRK